MTRPWKSRTALVAVLVAVGCVALGVKLARRRPVSGAARLESKTLTVVPGVHMLAGLGPSAAYVIESLDGLILIDSGLDADAAPLKAEIERLGLDWQRIIAIFLTHAHGDHTGGAEHLQKSTGARVYIGEGDADVLRQGTSRDAFFSTFPMPHHSPHPTRVDIALKGGERVRFGDVVVEALAMPGHTPGSHCYLVERAGKKILFTGDVVMHLGGPKTVGTYSAYLAPRYRGDAETFLRSLHDLRSRPGPDLVLPGHPFSDATPQNPRVSATRWREMIDDGIEELGLLLDRFREDGADFLDGTPRRISKNLAYLGDRDGKAVYLWSYPAGTILVNAPGGRGLASFVQQATTSLGLNLASPIAILLTSVPDQLSDAIAGFSQITVVTESRDLTNLVPVPDRILAPSQFAQEAGVPLESIALQGRGVAPVAFRIQIDDRQVLFTPDIPASSETLSTSGSARGLAADRGSLVDFLASVSSLATPEPEVWLPATPSEGQNANLYDHQWREIISTNLRAGYQLLHRAR